MISFISKEARADSINYGEHNLLELLALKSNKQLMSRQIIYLVFFKMTTDISRKDKKG